MNEEELLRALANGQSFAGATLHGCDFRGKSLVGANLAGAKLSYVRFEGADLRGANLSGATLTACRLGAAVLEGARLDEATLTGVDLSGAFARGARLDGAKALNLVAMAADLRQTSMIGVTFPMARLQRCASPKRRSKEGRCSPPT